MTLSFKSGQPDFRTMIAARGFCTVSPAGSGSGNLGTSKAGTIGRYTITDVTSGVSCDLVANSNWKGDKPQINKARFEYIPDEQMAEQAYKTNQVQIMKVSRDVLYNRAPFLSAVRDGGQLRTVTTGRILYMAALAPRAGDSMMASREVRNAIQHAIDPVGLIERAYGGNAEPVTGLTPSGWSWKAPPRSTDRDPNGARLVLQRLPQTLVLGFFPNLLRPMAAVVAEMLSGLGAKVVLFPSDGGSQASVRTVIEGSHLLLSRANIWNFGLADALQRFVGLHPGPGFSDLYRSGTQVRTQGALGELETGLVSQGWATFLAEEKDGWALRRPSQSDQIPQVVFTPTGQIGDIGDIRLG